MNAYIENPSLTQENQLKPHVPLYPFDSETQALSHDRQASSFFTSLNGTWDFIWKSQPPKEWDSCCEKAEASQNWETIEVPGTWQMQGFGYNVYRNIPMEFSPYDPPKVPDHINPTALYKTSFTYNPKWKDRLVHLNFEGVKSAFWVWINGTYIGFDKGSMTSAEFDITPYLQSGTNSLCVMVVRWSDGSYLEDQDMWRFSGIYRSVYLTALPKTYFRDLTVITRLDKAYENASLQMNLDVVNSAKTPINGKINVSLFDEQGLKIDSFTKAVTLQGKDTKQIALERDVKNPKKWSAEKPNLYSAVIKLLDKDDKVIEIVEERIGFRELAIKDKVLLVNGVPVKIKGVNRHEHDPKTGRTISRDAMIADFELMKQLNVNSIRTSHYPNDPLFYDLADEYGFYICDEVNAECHYGETFLAAQQGWAPSFMDRTIGMVERDKNHPSIIMWSMGNECGLAPIHYQMAAYAKEKDPTRFIYHQPNDVGQYFDGDAPFADINGERYPSPVQLASMADTIQKPVIMGEYFHTMGNAGGHFDEYWKVIYDNEKLQGGYTWDWVNQGLQLPLVTTLDKSKYKNKTMIVGNPKFVQGRSGKGLSFSGIDDWVEVYNTEKLNVTGNQLTVEAWVYPRGFQNSNVFVSKGKQYQIAQHHKDSVFFGITVAPKWLFSGNTVLATEHKVSAAIPKDWDYNWHHLVGVYDGVTLNLFLDGQKVSSRAVQGNIDRSRSPICIGKNHFLHAEQFNGFLSNAIIDDVAVHATKRTEKAFGDKTASPIIDDTTLLYLDFESRAQIGTYESYGATPNSSGTMDGIVNADRTLQPEAWQVKKGHQPVFVTMQFDTIPKITVSNRHHFTDLKEVKTKWQLFGDGYLIEEGVLALAVAPNKSTTVGIPLQKPDLLNYKDYQLLVSFHQKEKTPLLPADFEIAFEQFRLPWSEDIEKQGSSIKGGSMALNEDQTHVAVQIDDLKYTFSKASGTLSQIMIGNTPLLSSPQAVDVWRAPILNEWSTWGVPEADLWYMLGLDTLKHDVKSFKVTRLSNEKIQISSNVISTSQFVSTVQFDSQWEYLIGSDGLIDLKFNVAVSTEQPGYPVADIPWIPVLGIKMDLKNNIKNYNWYGRGPFETYPDRKTAAKISRYESQIDAIEMPYMVPQDFGNYADVTQVALLQENGLGFEISADNPINFKIDPYENLDKVWYPFQLIKKESPTLHLDFLVTGVGGTSIPVQPNYRVYPKNYNFQLKFQPVQGK
ncbi:MAG: glycoside hydrolase family 2 TIM barrel-domain containing protein, partial [Bacteroidota bacterium]